MEFFLLKIFKSVEKFTDKSRAYLAELLINKVLQELYVQSNISDEKKPPEGGSNIQLSIIAADASLGIG